MTNGDILTAYEALQRISNNPQLKFNVTAGYLLTKNKEILRQEAIIIYNMRRDIILERGKIEDNKIIIPNDYIDEVNNKINELMNIENDIQIKQIPIDLISKYELTIEDIEGLLPIIQPFDFTGPPILEKKDD